MNRAARSLVRLAGSLAGLVVGGAALPAAMSLLFLVLGNAASRAGFTFETSDPTGAGGIMVAVMVGVACVVVGATGGSAIGATLAQKALGMRSSWWRALAGAAVGLLLGGALLYPLYLFTARLGGWWLISVVILTPCVTVIAGSVVGSGWKARPALYYA